MKTISLIILFTISTFNLYAASNSFVERIKFYSDIRAREYEIIISYTENFDLNNSENYKSIYFQDGFFYSHNIKTIQHIDSLYNRSKIEDFVSIYIEPTDRTVEFLFDKKEFADFICLELVPYIDSNFNTSTNPKDRTMIGLSYGGNFSAYLCYIYPGIFGNCGLQSAAFRPTYDVFNLYKNGEKRDVDFYAVWGDNESPIGEDMRKFRENVISKGYSFIGEEFQGEGHTISFWGSTIETLIEYFLNKGEKVAVESPNIIADNFKLNQNYPNPFNPTTNISFTLDKMTTVNLSIFNSLGQKVETILDDNMRAGFHNIVWNGNKLSSGIYFYRLSTNGFNEIKEMNLIK